MQQHTGPAEPCAVMFSVAADSQKQVKKMYHNNDPDVLFDGDSKLFVMLKSFK